MTDAHASAGVLKRARIRIATLLGGPVAASVLAWLVRLLYLSTRKQMVGGERMREMNARGGNYVIAFWHSRLLMMRFVYEGPGIHVLVSAHRDGEIVSGMLAKLGAPSVRGSSRRGGARALVQMARLLEQGRDLGTAADGPRGPVGVVKPGTAWLCARTGRPVVPAAFSASRALRLRTWDRLLIPRPFSRAFWVAGEPITPREGEGVEELRRRIEAALHEVTARADAVAGLAEPGDGAPPVSGAPPPPAPGARPG